MKKITLLGPGRSDGTKEEVLNYLQPTKNQSPSPGRPMSASGKKGIVKSKVPVKKKEPTPLQHESELIDRHVMESQLARSLQEINTLQVSYFEQARNFITHSHDAAHHALLENQELRGQIAMLRKNINEDSPYQPHELLSRHHTNAKQILIKKDADLRNAARENAELRERLQELEEEDLSFRGEVLMDVSQDKGSSDGDRRSRPPSALTDSSVSHMPAPPAPMEVSADLMQEMRLPGQVYAAESFLRDEDDDSLDEERVFKAPPKRIGTAIRDKKGSSALDMKKRMENMFRSDPMRDNPYKDSGCCGWLVNRLWFDSASMAAIALNVIWIGIDTMYNKEDLLVNADAAFIVIENIFCVVFTAELLIRIGAMKQPCSVFKDPSAMFDIILVLFMITETWILFLIMLFSGAQIQLFDPSVIRMLRLLRLSRVARIVRILRKLPEIMILIKAIGVASRSVFFTMLLLLAVIYVFAIAFVHMTKDTTVGKAYFNRLPMSMYTLLFSGCFFDGLEPMAAALFQESFFLGCLLLLYMLFAPLMLMNLLVGVLVAVIGIVADSEQENMDIQYVTEAIQDYMSRTVEDGQEMVTKSEFQAMLESDEAVTAFVDVDIDVVALAESPDLIFTGEDSMGFREFMEQLLLLRGSNMATLKDVVQARKHLAKDFEQVLGDQLHEVKQGVSKLKKKR